MTTYSLVAPEEVGLSSRKLEKAFDVLNAAVRDGTVPGAQAAIIRHGKLAQVAACGQCGPEAGSPPVREDTIFLVASLTKPITCAGVMLLVQEGLISLEQPVNSLLPEFGKKGKDRIMVRHLLTHTSGLPDQLPNNTELRQRHAPISEFVREVMGLEPLFRPGTRISYQSMGILTLAEIVERLTSRRLRDFLRQELFQPLGMEDTTLGMPDSGMERAALVPSPEEAEYGDSGADWGWNSPYWRDFGAPWGGLHATAADLGRFLAHVLGDLPGPLSPAARRAMVQDHTALMPDLSEKERMSHRWGLGWSLGLNAFGDLTSRDTFGHIGATGTVYWADPATHLACVLLTNKPGRNNYLFARYSNAVAATVEE